MKCWTGIATLLIVLGVAGCDQPTPGEADMAGTNPGRVLYREREDKFSLSVPLRAARLRQGTTVEIVVTIERTANFNEEVSLKVFRVPEGVTVSPPDPVIKHSDENASISFTANDEAATGEYMLIVFGHPNKGPDAEIEFRLTVVRK